MSAVTIRHFTDPGCPFAFSAERQRLRLLWLYGDQVEWELHTAGELARTARFEPVGGDGYWSAS